MVDVEEIIELRDVAEFPAVGHLIRLQPKATKVEIKLQFGLHSTTAKED